MARPVQASLPLLLVVVALFAAAEVAAEGSCSASSPCPDPTHCCSKFSYCGTGDEYCGTGCVSGPCNSTSTPTPPSSPGDDTPIATPPSPPGDDTPIATPPSPPGGATPIATPPSPHGGATPPSSPGGAGWSSFFTQSEFSKWFPSPNSLYTFQAFSDAASAYSAFGTSGSADDQKREIAAFFGNVVQESGSLTKVDEDNPPNDYCDTTYPKYPCVEGKKYYGRGPLQISYNYNYGQFGEVLGVNLLADPDQVAQSGDTAFKAALWFWMTSGCHEAILQPSFGGTISTINSRECGLENDPRVNNRVNAYTGFCQNLNVDPGAKLRC